MQCSAVLSRLGRADHIYHNGSTGTWSNLVTGQSAGSSLISLITLSLTSLITLITLAGLINHPDHSDNSSLWDEAADLIADNVLAKHSTGEKQPEV